MLAKIGPFTKRKTRRPVVRSSSMTSVPVMSVGMRSGVNWIRLNLRSRASAIVCTSSVLAKPGTPTSSAWPFAKSAVSSSSTTSCWPTMRLATSARIKPETSATRSSSSRSRSRTALCWVVVMPVRGWRCRSLDGGRRSGRLAGVRGRYLLRQSLDIPGRPLADPGVHAGTRGVAKEVVIVAKIGGRFFHASSALSTAEPA